MISISIPSQTHDLYIDVQGDSIGFTILSNDKNTQIDFDCEPGEWELIKTFVDNQLKKTTDETIEH